MKSKVRSFDISRWAYHSVKGGRAKDPGAPAALKDPERSGPGRDRSVAERTGPGGKRSGADQRLSTEQETGAVPCSAFVYRVRPGDTFFLIAQRFGITLGALIAANPQVEDPDQISPGELICVPARPTCPREIDGFIYTVLMGDTLTSIAETFDVSGEDILAVNPQIDEPDEIFAGEPICIPRLEPVIELPCCSVLSPTQALPGGFRARGTVLIQGSEEEGFALTFAAVGLPDPATLGDFDSYIGSIQIGEQLYSAILSGAAPGEQPVTWCGTRVISDDPTGRENALFVSPFNLDTNVRGPFVLRGVVSECS